MFASSVDVFGGPAALMCRHQLDQPKPLERAYVVGDGPERGVEPLGQLHRTGVALFEHRQDPDTQGMSQRFDITRVIHVGYGFDC